MSGLAAPATAQRSGVHRYHLAAMTNHVVGVTGGQFAHEGHGNEVDRQHDVTTRRRSTIKVEAKASPAADPNGQPRTPPFMCLRLLYLITIRLFIIPVLAITGSSRSRV
jgi:hypothetical protein